MKLIKIRQSEFHIYIFFLVINIQIYFINYSNIGMQSSNTYCPKDLEDELKFDCFPEANANEIECSRRGCCWSPSDVEFVPFCYYPSNFALYSFINISQFSDNHHSVVVNDFK